MSGSVSQWRVVATLALVASSACAVQLPSALQTGCPVVPVSSFELLEQANLRARMRMRVGEDEVGFELVARAQSGELVVVGLAPSGVRLFSVRQHGREFEVDANSSLRLNMLALWVMDALHRIYWIAPVVDGSSGQGDEEFEWAGERVRESWSAGKRRRRFDRADTGAQTPGVTIDYSRSTGSNRDGRVEIRSRWCGYEAVAVRVIE